MCGDEGVARVAAMVEVVFVVARMVVGWWAGGEATRAAVMLVVARAAV